MFFRRADYAAVGGWHPDRRCAMDLDLWMRLATRGRFLGQTETLAAFRVGGHSLSAENGAGIYGDQRAIVDEASASPQLRVRPVDRAVAGSARPRAGCAVGCCSSLSARTSHRDARVVRPGRRAPQVL